VNRVPNKPKIYHITHVDNLSQIARSGCLWSDARRHSENCQCRIVGMSEIKRRRLKEIEVTCHSGTKVGQYVPFYFCPRSIMLYLLHRGNHQDMDYHEGQGPIVHLKADLIRSVEWAKQSGRKWAFTDRNAGSYLTSFYNFLDQLDKINWEAVFATNWSDALIKEGKQAEFLMLDSFPWELVDKIGVIDQKVQVQVQQIIRNSPHKPLVTVEQKWYY